MSRKLSPWVIKSPERPHDALYLQDKRKFKPKESFKFVLRHALPFLRRFSALTILDIGCATGDFLWYTGSILPKASLYGIDVRADLLTRARREVPGAQFWKADISTGKGLPNRKFDAVFLIGVHGMFDTCDGWLDHLLSMTSPKGRVFVFSTFNPENVDVLMRARYADGKSEWQPGWNIWSKKTMCEELRQRGCRGTFHRFSIDIDLPRHPDDPLRSWTIRQRSKDRILVNGAQIILPFYLLIIKK